MTKSPENEHLPKHVAIIMDGNGRWAKQRGLPRGEGHKQGAKVFKRICEYAADRGIRYVTFYAFSTENWRRPPEEVSGIMDLFREYLREAEEREQENAQKGLRIRYIGEREGLADDILELVDELERGSADKVRTTVNIAINYGGRNEILSACKRLAEQCARGAHTREPDRAGYIRQSLYGGSARSRSYNPPKRRIQTFQLPHLAGGIFGVYLFRYPLARLYRAGF